MFRLSVARALIFLTRGRQTTDSKSWCQRWISTVSNGRERRACATPVDASHIAMFLDYSRVNGIAMSPTAKVTYISLSADDPALDAAFASAIADVRAELGRDYPLHVAGETRAGGAADREPQPGGRARGRGARRDARPRPTCATPSPPRSAAFPSWSARPLAGARRDRSTAPPTSCASAASSSRPGSSSRWGRTASRRWARSKRPPTSTRTTPPRCARTPATCARWGGWCRPTRTPACCARTACGR